MSYLRFFLLLLLSGPAFAQVSPHLSQPGPVAAASPSAAPDTAAAIHRLFAAKRHQSSTVIGATVGTGLVFLALAEATRHSAGIDAFPVVATGISLLSIPVTIAEVLHYRKFTCRKEAGAIAALANHKLPARTRKKLQAVYFQ